MSDWIPIDRVTIDVHRTYEVMWPDGSKDRRSGNSICNEAVVAVRDVTPSRPKRRHGHIRISEHEGERIYATDIFVAPGELVNVREVLPGDCDPDVARDVAREMQDMMYPTHEIKLGWMISTSFIKRLEALQARLHMLAQRLEGTRLSDPAPPTRRDPIERH